MNQSGIRQIQSPDKGPKREAPPVPKKGGDYELARAVGVTKNGFGEASSGKTQKNMEMRTGVRDQEDQTKHGLSTGRQPINSSNETSIEKDNVYDEIVEDPAQLYRANNEYFVLQSTQEEYFQKFNQRLDTLETKQDQLCQEFQQSQKTIVSEISHLKNMISSLNILTRDSLSKSQKMAADSDKNIRDFAENLGQEVFQVGQEIMSAIKTMSDAEQARGACMQMLMNKNEETKTPNKIQPPRNSLPSL